MWTQETMITGVPYRIGLACQVQTAGVGGQLVVLTLLSAGVGLGLVGWLTGLACAVVTCALLTLALRRSRARGLGPADRVTLARAVLVGGVTALVTDHLGEEPPAVVLVALASVALLLDAVDGQVARRTGTVSPLGARFDMEVDAFLILVLSVHVATSLDAWVPAIGAMRYVFVAATWVAPWLRSALPPSSARKTVAALQGIILVVAAAGVLPRPVTTVLVGLALTLLVWSFGRDIVWLWRNRRESAGPPETAPAASLALTPGTGTSSIKCPCAAGTPGAWPSHPP
jgi:phosphatidylglycerophosphate synthase